GDADKYFRSVVGLFDRLALESPGVARVEVSSWPANETFFFDKLRIYAGMKPDVVSADEMVSWLVSLPDERFWNAYHRRELLHSLRARWAALGRDARERIESRIIKGPARWRDEEQTHYDARKASTAATILGWLERNGCELSPEALALLPSLREANPRWQPNW